MNIEEIPIAELDLDPANVRQHDEKNLAAIKSSLKRFGQQKPIVVDPKGIVIAGNGTLTAARALGWDRIRIVRTQLEGSEATAYAIADNRTAELATWDDDALMQQLSALDLEDSALVEAAGFSAAELEGMVDGLLGEKELNEDEVPEVPDDPITQPGDLWILGDHRLLCGDSTKAEDVERLMDGEKADMVFTDPPYGMNLDTNFQDIHQGATTGSNHRPVLNDADEFDPNCIFATDCKEILIWGADYFHHKLPKGGSWYCWDKTLGQFEGRIGNELELLWSKIPHKRLVFRYQWVGYNGLQSQDTDKRVHPNQKPVELYIECLNLFDHKLILDLFGGSGTTLIACEKTSRHCRMMELDPAYCDVIVERWENLTGRKAELERRADDDQEKIQSQA